MLNVQFALRGDRIEFDNTVNRDHAIAALAIRSEFAAERGVLYFQYGNRRRFLYFALGDSCDRAYVTLVELNDAYARMMLPLYERAEQRFRLQPPLAVPLDKQHTAQLIASRTKSDVQALLDMQSNLSDDALGHGFRLDE